MRIQHWDRKCYIDADDGLYDLNDFELLYESCNLDSSNESEFYLLTKRLYAEHGSDWFNKGINMHLIILAIDDDSDYAYRAFSFYIRKSYVEELTVQIYKEFALK